MNFSEKKNTNSATTFGKLLLSILVRPGGKQIILFIDLKGEHKFISNIVIMIQPESRFFRINRFKSRRNNQIIMSDIKTLVIKKAISKVVIDRLFADDSNFQLSLTETQNELDLKSV